MGEWISVEDRLPEKDGVYLCWVGASNYLPVRIMEYKPLYPNDLFYRRDENLWRTVLDINDQYVFNWFVKAWMPLPEPPKE